MHHRQDRHYLFSPFLPAVLRALALPGVFASAFVLQACGAGSSGDGREPPADDDSTMEPTTADDAGRPLDAAAPKRDGATLDAVRRDATAAPAMRDAARPVDAQRERDSDGDGGDASAAGSPHDGGSGGRSDGGTRSDDAAVGETLRFVGNITTRGQVRPDFAGLWNQITPENEGKWGTVERTRDVMDWSGLDRIRDYAKQHGLVFKQHAFVWGSQQPSWISALPRQEQAAEVEEWIQLFCERYPEVALIDVVNEPPPHTTPTYLEALGGAGASGHDWIAQSFTLARKYCPSAILILNDYNNIEYGGDNSRFIAIVKALKQAGAPIDAVGAQAHDAYKLPVSTVKQLLDKLATETGLPVYITEYDLDLADDAQQRQVMEAQFSMFWKHPNVKGITLWGYVSGATWRPNTGLMSEAGSPRPALSWLLEYLKSERAKP